MTDLGAGQHARDALLDAGIALSRAVDVGHAWPDVARLARRATGCDAIAIAIGAEETGEPVLVFQSGFDEADTALAARLGPQWAAAIAAGSVVTSDGPDRTTIVAPIPASSGNAGAIALAGARRDDAQARTATERTVVALASQIGAAIERAWSVRRADHKRRVDTIGEVAAGVAQELRNPLFGISSAAQLLRFRTGEDPVVEKNVGRILREVERLNRMVTSLLEYGRPAPATLAPHDPDAVWDAVLDALRGRVESKGLVVDRHRANPPVVCAADGDQLGQLFSHLMVNACDASVQGGHISIESAAAPAATWRVTVHNGGTVIAPDVVPRVFDLFVSTKPGGTGIGLALCQRIVAEHRGAIAIDSGADRGTTVTVSLPLAS